MGRVKKFLAENALLDQPFVKDPDTTVGELVKKAGADVVEFVRFEVGEGIAKEEVDFAAEVARGSQGLIVRTERRGQAAPFSYSD